MVDRLSTHSSRYSHLIVDYSLGECDGSGMVQRHTDSNYVIHLARSLGVLRCEMTNECFESSTSDSYCLPLETNYCAWLHWITRLHKIFEYYQSNEVISKPSNVDLQKANDMYSHTFHSQYRDKSSGNEVVTKYRLAYHNPSNWNSTETSQCRWRKVRKVCRIISCSSLIIASSA